MINTRLSRCGDPAHKTNMEPTLGSNRSGGFCGDFREIDCAIYSFLCGPMGGSDVPCLYSQPN